MTVSFLPARNHLIEKFSSFIMLEVENSVLHCRWYQDKRLIRNMNQSMVSLPQDQDRCFLYWLERVEGHPLAKYHATAYLEDACYWAVKKFFSKVSLKIESVSQVELCQQAFDTVRERTTNIEKLVNKYRKFNPQCSSVYNYGEQWLISAIYDAIYQNYGIGKYSKWGILKNATKKSLTTALTIKGYRAKEKEDYLLVWTCWQQVYGGQTKKGRLTSPSREQVERITNLYHSLTNHKLTASKFEEYMTICATALTELQQQKHLDIYAVRFSQGETEESPTLTEAQLVQPEPTATEPSPYLNLMVTVLEQQLEQIKTIDKTILILHYGLGCKQSLIASVLGKNQSTVCRRLNNLTHNLLERVADNISGQQLTVTINSQFLEANNELMKQWLKSFFARQYHQQIAVIYTQLRKEEKELLTAFYGVKIDGERQAINDKIKIIVTKLTKQLITYINQQLNIIIKDEEEIAFWVEDWLITAPYAQLNN